MQSPKANLSPIIDAQNQLCQQFKAFTECWAATKEDWRDAKREQFERDHLQQLGPSLARLSAALDQWRDLVVRADRELAESTTE